MFYDKWRFYCQAGGLFGLLNSAAAHADLMLSRESNPRPSVGSG
jgi:hypothetical protein